MRLIAPLYGGLCYLVFFAAFLSPGSGLCF